MYITTIDTGTTNTRVRLWSDGHLVTEGFASVGVRDTAVTGNTAALAAGVRQALADSLKRAVLAETDIGLILAAGMITSNVGLFELPHIIAPAGIGELAAGMASAVLPEITSLPIWFIPGVKNTANSVTLDTCDTMDIMRGEEAEVYGLLAQTDVSGPAIILLPGSHTKMVQLDAKNRITGSVTSMTGELLAVITQHTLLANSLNKSFASHLEPQALLAGAKQARSVGLGRACFQVRLLDLFSDQSVSQQANYLLGAVLAEDLSALAASKAIDHADTWPLIIGGSGMIARGLELLLRAEGRSVRLLDDSIMRLASGLGCLAIAKVRGLY